MACVFCEGGTDYNTGHAACRAEWNRRIEAGKCIRCGERDGYWCNKCLAMERPPWVGYPPGGV